MSRHRNVRNMDIDDVLDDGYDEEDYVEEPTMSREEQAQMADATEAVLEMLGSAKVPIKDIEDALWYYYFDVDQAVTYLVDQIAAAEQKKQKTVSGKKTAPPAPVTPSVASTPAAKSSAPPLTGTASSTASKGTVMHDSFCSLLSSSRKQILSKRHIQDWIWRDLRWGSGCIGGMVDMEPVVSVSDQDDSCQRSRQQQRRLPGRPIGFPVTGLLGGMDPSQQQGTPVRSLAEQAAAGTSRTRPSLTGLANASAPGLSRPMLGSGGGAPSLTDLAKSGSSTSTGTPSRLGQFSRLASSSSSSPSATSVLSSSPLASTSSLQPPLGAASGAHPSMASLAKSSASSSSTRSATITNASSPSMSSSSPSLAQLASQSSSVPARRSLASLARPGAPSFPTASPLQQPSSKPISTPSPATNTPLSSLASLRNTLPSAGSSNLSPLSSFAAGSTSTPPPPQRSLASLAKPAATVTPKASESTTPFVKEKHVDTQPPSLAAAPSPTAWDMSPAADEPSFTLIAPPSHFAMSIFEPLQPISKYMLSGALEAAVNTTMTAAKDNSNVLEQTMFQLGERASFQFDKPSPDDIVAKAQSRRTNNPIAAK